MGEPFFGEIRMMSFNFPPRNWAQCDGKLIPINQNVTLFSLLGTRFGGNGQTDFALPDLRGRVPISADFDGVYYLGKFSGTETETINLDNMPEHTHMFEASRETGTTGAPFDKLLARTNPPTALYGPARNLVGMKAEAVSTEGGGQAHTNVQPSLALNFVIALQGIYPSRT